jgi:hypothetical protein
MRVILTEVLQRERQSELETARSEIETLESDLQEEREQA